MAIPLNIDSLCEAIRPARGSSDRRVFEAHCIDRKLAAVIVVEAKRGRANTISPGIIITPLANDELNGPRGAGYRRMIDISAAGRAGTLDEVGTIGALLMGSDGGFITGNDFLMDGGVTAANWFGELASEK